MNKNMRKMYSEQEIAELIQNASDDRILQLGKYLYIISYDFTVKDGQTVDEGCEQTFRFQIFTCRYSTGSAYLPLLTVIWSQFRLNGLVTKGQPQPILKMYATTSTPSTAQLCIDAYDLTGTEHSYKLDVNSKYDVTVTVTPIIN